MSDVGETVSRQRQLAFPFLSILEHFHSNDGERPVILSASSHQTLIETENTMSEMEVDREVNVPPPAVPPAAPPVVEASPNSSERKEITNWPQKTSINRLQTVAIAPW